MPFSYRDLICGGKTFCCCLPVRFGVISMSVLGMLVAGLLSIVLWFEVAATMNMKTGERAAFVTAALVETILFFASILGFVGAVVRKQSFLQIYAYILYGHFIANIGAAAYLLHSIVSFQKNITVQACEQTVTDPRARDQCKGLLRVTATIFIAAASVVLFVELYGAIIVTRHLNQVQRHKRNAKAIRQDMDTAFRLKTRSFAYTPLADPSAQYPPQYETEFNPYADVEGTTTAVHSRNNSDLTRQPSAIVDVTRPPIPVELGYGGGSWTHTDISEEEKARLQRLEGGPSVPNEDPSLTEEEKAQRRNEQKSIHGPSSLPLADIEPLPQYTSVPQVERKRPSDSDSLR